MLVVTRRPEERIVIGTEPVPIVIVVTEIRSDRVLIGIQAPRHIPVHRQEVWDEIHNPKV